MDNLLGHKRVLLKNIGPIDSLNQLQKAVIFITQSKSIASVGGRRAALKHLWWDSHLYNKKNWSDLEWECKGIKRERVNHYTKQSLSKQSIQELLNACRTERQKLFIEYLVMTGSRVSEMTDILLSDCRTNGLYIDISIKTKKTQVDLHAQIPHRLYERIQKQFLGTKYLFETSGGKSLRPEYVSNQIKKIGKLININISAHSLRHFYVTNRIDKRDDPIEISRSIGHKNIGSIFNYYYTGKIQKATV